MPRRDRVGNMVFLERTKALQRAAMWIPVPEVALCTVLPADLDLQHETVAFKFDAGPNNANMWLCDMESYLWHVPERRERCFSRDCPSQAIWCSSIHPRLPVSRFKKRWIFLRSSGLILDMKLRKRLRCSIASNDDYPNSWLLSLLGR